IVPRTMGALGYVMQVPEEEKYLNSRDELIDMIVGLLGGRAAEELKFHSITTGASNDIERATALARSMVTQYGMSEKFGVMGLATVQSQYLDGKAYLNCSDTTAALVDEEVRRILEECYGKAREILSENMDALDLIADYLIRQETISGKEFMKLYRQAKGIPEPVEEKKTDRGQEGSKEEKKEETVSGKKTEDVFEILEEAPAPSHAEEAPAEEAPEEPAAEEEETEPAPPEDLSKEAAPEKEEPSEEEEKAPRGTRGRYSQVPLDDLDLFSEE
ncbi:MAG: ATP-dependent metallopeptidase HflB, partial [Lachnospiraceae bacterium]|nr:ATP-dependent metallopeptidase HflB [Lachnospiraceae bacterium]